MFVFYISDANTQCVDDASFTKAGKNCVQLIRESSRYECYDGAVEEGCCSSCSQLKIGVTGIKIVVHVSR